MEEAQTGSQSQHGGLVSQPWQASLRPPPNALRLESIAVVARNERKTGAKRPAADSVSQARTVADRRVPGCQPDSKELRSEKPLAQGQLLREHHHQEENVSHCQERPFQAVSQTCDHEVRQPTACDPPCDRFKV